MQTEATLTLEGLYGRLDTSLPYPLREALLQELQATDGLAWVDVTNLNKRELFIGKDADGIIWYLHGVHEIVERTLRHMGFLLTVRRRSMQRHHHAWELTCPPDHPSQPVMIDTLCHRRRGGVQAPPGTGKTYVIAGVTARLGVNTLCLTYNNKPTQQVYESFGFFTNIQPGLIDGNGVETRSVTVASCAKLLAMLNSPEGQQWWDAYRTFFELVIIDEAHHLASPGTTDILRNLTGMKGVMAVSATYGRADDKGPTLLAYGGPLWHVVGLSEVVGTKLVPLTIEVASVPAKGYGQAEAYNEKKKTQGIQGVSAWQQSRTRNEGGRIYAAIRKDYIVQGSTGRNEIIARYVSRMRQMGRTTAIIIKEIEHAETLCALIPNAVPLVKSNGPLNIRASTDAQANQIIDALRHREIDCVITTTFDEAVDVPSLDCIVLAAGGKSWIKAWQRLRNTRSCDKLLRTGHYKKERGYLLILHDHAPMLEAHSQETLKEMRKYVAAHEDNEMFKWDWNKE